MDQLRAFILVAFALAAPTVAVGQYPYPYVPTAAAPPAREAPPSQVLEEPLPSRAPQNVPPPPAAFPPGAYPPPGVYPPPAAFPPTSPLPPAPQLGPPPPWQPNSAPPAYPPGIPDRSTSPSDAPFNPMPMPPAPPTGQSLTGPEPDLGWVDDPMRVYWTGSFTGLILGRGNLNGQVFGFDTTTSSTTLGSGDAQPAWQGGGEVTLGAWRCNCGVEATFFSIAPLTGSASLRDTANTINSAMDFSGVTIGGAAGTTFFDGAREQQLNRKDYIYNGEVNFVRHVMAPPCGASLDLLAGFRYLNFNDNLSYGSVKGGSEFGSAGGTNEAYFDVRANNNLYGGQIGARATYRPCQRWGLFAAPKLGLFDNSVTFRQHLHRGDGVDTFDLHSSRQSFAVLGQIDAGTDYVVGKHLRLFIGYRVMGVTGVALADQQYPASVQSTLATSHLNLNGNLLLHGGLAGFEVRY